MTAPDTRAAVGYGGITIHTVESGTVVEHDGEKLTVTDTQAVVKGRSIYMTQENFDALKAHAHAGMALGRGRSR